MGSAALGTKLKIGTDYIGELTDIGGPSISVDDIDVSHHESADEHREFVAGLVDSGEVSLEGNATQTNLNLLLTKLQGRTAETVTIEYPTGTVNDLTFSGFVSALEPGAPFEDKIGFSATIRTSGKVTLAQS